MTEAFLQSLEIKKLENGYYGANLSVFTSAVNYIKNGGSRVGFPFFKSDKTNTIIEAKQIEYVYNFIQAIYQKEIKEPFSIDLFKKCIQETTTEENQQPQNTPELQAAPDVLPAAPIQETIPAQPEVPPTNNNQQQPPSQRPRRVPKKQQPEAPPVVQQTNENKGYTIEDGVLSFHTAQFSEEIKKELCRILGISPALGFSTIEFQTN